MPGFRFSRLIEDFVDQLERSSATVIRPLTWGRRPARIRVVSGNGTTECIVFLWTITPGGGGEGVRPRNERRIQVTNAQGFPLEPGCRTLLGGWNSEFGVYAFWDPRRHTRFSPRSPSLQIAAETLETAQRVGVATYLRPSAEGREVVVAVAPDSLLWYVESGHPLHDTEDDGIEVELFAESRPDTAHEERAFIDESQSEDQAERRYELVTVMRAYRDAKFKPIVLRAYRYKCAVCQCALKLVDAAHIVPVTLPESSDDVTNGLALCRLHHGAYDNGLLGIKANYSVVLNSDAESRLSSLELDAGIQEFKARLPPTITVPHSIEARPDPRNLLIGLRARNWPDDHST